MIEITLLKVTHSGEQEARKLIPYIQKCDFFGVENACGTENGAAAREKSWEEIILAKNMVSRSLLQKFVSERLIKHTQDERVKEYLQKTFDYLFRNERLLWSVERFSPESAKEVYTLHEKSSQLAKAASNALMQSNFENFVSLYHAHFNGLNKAIKLRDIEIARNLSEAEDRLRSFYPSLCDKHPLRYTLFVGGLHEPERYYSPLCVVPLEQKKDLEYKVQLAIKEGIPSSELKKELLALALERGFKVPSAQSMSSSYEALIVLAQKAVQERQQNQRASAVNFAKRRQNSTN